MGISIFKWAFGAILAISLGMNLYYVSRSYNDNRFDQNVHSRSSYVNRSDTRSNRSTGRKNVENLQQNDAAVFESKTPFEKLALVHKFLEASKDDPEEVINKLKSIAIDEPDVQLAALRWVINAENLDIHQVTKWLDTWLSDNPKEGKFAVEMLAAHYVEVSSENVAEWLLSLGNYDIGNAATITAYGLETIENGNYVEQWIDRLSGMNRENAILGLIQGRPQMPEEKFVYWRGQLTGQKQQASADQLRDHGKAWIEYWQARDEEGSN